MRVTGSPSPTLVNIALNAMQVRAAKTGVGQYIHALLEAMVEQATQDQFTVYCNAANVANYKLPVANLSTPVWGLSGRARALRLLHEYALFPRELANQHYDVFHGASNFLPLRKVCPYVVTIHDLSYYVHPWRCPPVRRRYWYMMTANTVAVADRIISDSENTRQDIARFFPKAAGKIRVVHCAAHSRFRPLPYDRGQARLPEVIGDRPYILYVGTLEPGKNVERTIHAFEAVAADYPHHQLALVGDRGWLFESIFAAAEKSPFRDRILFLGHLHDETVVELFNFCELFVYPSLYEGFGLPPLEAMACGAPVITSNTSSIPEVVGDAAVTVAPTDDAALAAAMRQVLADEGLRKDLRTRGLARAAQFSWRTAAQQTLEVYREVADNGNESRNG